MPKKRYVSKLGYSRKKEKKDSQENEPPGFPEGGGDRDAGRGGGSVRKGHACPRGRDPRGTDPHDRPCGTDRGTAAPGGGNDRVPGRTGTADLRAEEQEKFQAENPNIEWVQVEQPEVVSRLEQLLTLVAAGTPPDCARVESDVYRTFCHYGLLLGIYDRIAADPVLSAPDYWIQPQERDRCGYEGEWYGIGSCWVAPHFYYNQSLFDELGVEPPSNDPDEAWIWDEFLEIARQLTVDTNGNHPGEAGFDYGSIDRWGPSGRLGGSRCTRRSNPMALTGWVRRLERSLSPTRGSFDEDGVLVKQFKGAHLESSMSEYLRPHAMNGNALPESADLLLQGCERYLDQWSAQS